MIDLIDLKNARRLKWEEETKNLDFTHSSRKGWNLLRKLDTANKIKPFKNSMNSNLIASHILKTSKGVNMEKKRISAIKRRLWRKKRGIAISEEYSKPFELEELEEAISRMKLGKAAGEGRMYPEFFKYLGDNAKRWVSFTQNLHFHRQRASRLQRRSQLL